MPMFRRKTIAVEAIQWFPGVSIEGVYEGIPSLDMPWDIAECVRDGINPQIPKCGALAGWMLVTPGYWVITGVSGERIICKPDIFEKTYEPA